MISKIKTKKYYLLVFILSTLSCLNTSNIFTLPQGRILFLGDSITQNGLYVSFIEHELFTQFPDKSFDIISIGLSSETVSGLSEPDHPFPRPCLHDRLEQALLKIQPDVIVACYGMNDGIYHPPDPNRLEAYQEGIRKLIDRAFHADIQHIILLTPPPFDPLPISERLSGGNTRKYGYATPYYKYHEVLQE